MSRFIELVTEYGDLCSLFKCHIRSEDVVYVGEVMDEPDKAAIVYKPANATVIVYNSPAEVLAKIEAAEGAAVEPVAVRPATMRVEDLREGDELDIGGHRIAFKWVRRDGDLAFSNISWLPDDLYAPQSQIAEMLARGVIVRRDGNMISGWPVGETGGGI